MFETDGGAAGSAVISQVSAGRKNRLWFELSGSSEALAFRPGAAGDALGRAPLRNRAVPRDFDTLTAAAAAYVTLPGGHPQGFHDCFDAFVAETYAAVRGEASADGLPRSPTACVPCD